MFDGARNYEDPGIPSQLAYPERLAASGAVTAPRRVRRVRDRIGDAAGIIIIAGLAIAALVAL